MPSARPSGSGGGGGLHFRDPVDVFADAAARTAAFGAGGTLEGEHVQFATDRALAIVIGTIANPTAFQTYTGGLGAYDDTAWLNRTDAVQGRTGADGTDGTNGADGAPGGGAWSSLGSHVQTDDHAAAVFVASGITLPANRSVFGYRLAGAADDLADQAGIMVVSMALLEGKDEASAGDTSASANRIRLPEFGGGGLIPGSFYAGLTSSREILLATSNANQDWAVEIFDYIPSAVQAGVSEMRVEELIAAARTTVYPATVDSNAPVVGDFARSTTSPVLVTVAAGDHIALAYPATQANPQLFLNGQRYGGPLTESSAAIQLDGADHDWIVTTRAVRAGVTLVEWRFPLDWTS